MLASSAAAWRPPVRPPPGTLPLSPGAVPPAASPGCFGGRSPGGGVERRGNRFCSAGALKLLPNRPSGFGPSSPPSASSSLASWSSGSRSRSPAPCSHRPPATGKGGSPLLCTPTGSGHRRIPDLRWPPDARLTSPLGITRSLGCRGRGLRWPRPATFSGANRSTRLRRRPETADTILWANGIRPIFFVLAVVGAPSRRRLPARLAAAAVGGNICPSDSGCYYVRQTYYGTCPAGGSSTAFTPTTTTPVEPSSTEASSAGGPWGWVMAGAVGVSWFGLRKRG
jgi:hypothetical protein